MIKKYSFATEKDSVFYKDVEHQVIASALSEIARSISFDEPHTIIVHRPEKYDPFDEHSFKLDRYKFWVAVDEELMKGTLTKDAENMLEVMDRTVNRADIWQDRCVYWLAVAVYHIIIYLLKRSK